MSDAFEQARFTGKVAVITGGAQGLGEGSARLLAARGAAGLVLVDRKPEGEKVAQSLRDAGTKAIFVQADLADPAQVARVVPAADAEFGRVDIVVNVAGLTDRGSILDTDLGLFDRMFAVNVRAPFFLIQDALKVMLREKIEGRIVNILSMNAHLGSPQLAAYSASKAALLNLTKNTAAAMNTKRIRVNGINLGWAETPGEHETLRKYHNAQDDWVEKAEASVPFGRLLKPHDVARMVAFLASDESWPMTGTAVDFEQSVFGAWGSGLDGYPGAD